VGSSALFQFGGGGSMVDITAAFSVAQVSERLGISERKIRQLIAAKDIQALRIGKRVLIRADILQRFVDLNTEPQASRDEK
jgi:excisionase family DNA binding protein